MNVRNLVFWVLLILAPGISAADYRVETVTSGLGVPWGMTFIDADRILFTERGGRAGIVDTRSGKVSYLSGIPAVKAEGQGGLLDVAVEPGYTSGGWIYFTYSKDQRGRGVTALARARLQGQALQGWQDILVTQSASGGGRHYGSRIAFDDQGYLYFSVGDRGDRPNGQNLQTHAGSVLRIKPDGRLPADNPFVGMSAALPEIWSFGHRNPQGLAWDDQHKRLWSIEHGPRGGDEINLVEKGKNYGWPVISYGKEYWGPLAVGEGTERAGMEQPVKYYVPSIAPGSLLVYSGEAFPEWQGDLFSGALKLRHLNQVKLDQAGRAIAEDRLLEDLGERIRALVQGPQGWIYFSTDSGKIFVIKP
ncbi:MAG: PQQ-dependent sugar dehydrogenase [Gammaproteobacteria bacterium]|nr:PQQ-dependent sugar dehydrogenase [Gammaproteobacteria bacterium]